MVVAGNPVVYEANPGVDEAVMGIVFFAPEAAKGTVNLTGALLFSMGACLYGFTMMVTPTPAGRGIREGCSRIAASQLCKAKLKTYSICMGEISST